MEPTRALAAIPCQPSTKLEICPGVGPPASSYGVELVFVSRAPWDTLTPPLSRFFVFKSPHLLRSPLTLQPSAGSHTLLSGLNHSAHRGF